MSSPKENHDSNEVPGITSEKDDVTTESRTSSSQEELFLVETPVHVNTEQKFDHAVPEPFILTETLENAEAIVPSVLETSVDVEHQVAEESFEVTPVKPIIGPEVSSIPQTRVVLDAPLQIENAAPHNSRNEALEQAPVTCNASAGSAVGTSPAPTMMKTLLLRRKHKPKKAPNAQVAFVQKSLKDFRAAEGKEKKAKATSTTQ